MYERWSTLHIEAQRRADFWREASSQAFLPMTPRLEKPRDFRAIMVHRGIDSIVFNEVRAPAHDMVRTSCDVARGAPPFVFLNLYAGGRCRIRQGHLDADAGPGQFLLLNGDSAYELEHPNVLELISLAVPHTLLRREIKTQCYDSHVLVPSAAASLLASQMRSLAQWAHDLGPAESVYIADAMVGMVRAVLSSQDTADATNNKRRLVRGVLRQLIERNYGDPSLSAVRAASELGMPVRTLHAWLARDGVTFGAYLLHYRLERAHAILCAGALHVPIQEVAARCGFVSAAHFTRRFRERYGATPSALRGS
jgi:AraC family transcriptional activator of tynA and feaB